MCGDTLRTQTKCIAIFQMVACSILLLLFSVLWIHLSNEDEYHRDKQQNRGAFPSTVVGLGISLILASFLLAGVEKESVSSCGVYYYINLVFFVLGVLVVGFLFLAGAGGMVIPELIGLCLNAYFLYIVKSYMEELRRKKEARPAAEQNLRNGDFNVV